MRSPVPFRRLLRVWDYLFGNATASPPRRVRLGFEPMEDRTMLTAVPLTGPDGGLWVKVDTLTVATQANQTPATGVVSSVVLDAGKTYLAVARGEARIANDATGYADAEYIRYTQAAGPQDGSSPGLPWVNHGVRLDGVGGGDSSGGFWGAYQSDHQYVRTVVGQGSKVSGYYTDIPGYYGDNSGSLTVDLYAEVPTVTLTPDAAAYVEGSVATLDGTYDPAVSGPNPVVTVDWGDGTPPDTLPAAQVAGGKFWAKHYYGDDRQPGDPNAVGQLFPGNLTAADKNTITATVAGAAPAPAQTARAVVTIGNAPPTRLDVVPQLPQPGQVAADGNVILLTTVADPSNPPAALPADVPLPALDDGLPPHDLFRRTVDWGDGRPPEVVRYDGAVRSVDHNYNLVGELNPGEKARAVEKTIKVTANDDDEPDKTVTGTATVRVRLEPPKLGLVTVQPTGRPVTEPISEGQRVTVSGSILHPGPAKWTSVLIDWGDKSEPTPAVVTTDKAGNVSYAAEHTYRDNNTTPGGGYAPYTVSVVATADKFAAFPLTGTARAAVRNAAPVVPAAGIEAVGPIEKRGVRIVGGAFTDLGADDTHTVVVDWGDKTAASVVSLAAGARGFDGAALAGLSHEYAEDGDYTITVTVRDDDGGTGTARLKFVAVSQDVLLKVFNTSKEIQTRGILDTIISYGGQFVDWVAGKASEFVTAVGAFAGDLRSLEAELRNLFGASLPKVLDALLENPFEFTERMLTSAKAGFDRFVGSAADGYAALGQNLQGIVLQWVATKAGAVGLKPGDLPEGAEWADPAKVAGFVMSLMGLTWDDLLAKVTTTLGPDNLAAVMEVYEFVKDAVADGKDGQVALLKAFDPANEDGALFKLLKVLNDPALGDQIKGFITEALGVEKLRTAGIDGAVAAAIKELPALIATTLGPLVTPIGGGFKAIQTAGKMAQWLVGNVKAVKEMVGVANALTAQVDVLRGPAFGEVQRDAVAGAIVAAIQKVGPTVVDFFASATGAAGVATAVGAGVKKARDKINKPLDDGLAKVGDAGKLLLAKGLPTGEGTAADYQGLAGKVLSWKSGDEPHRLWLRLDAASGNPELIIASTPAPLAVRLDQWSTQWRRFPQVMAALEQLRQAVRQLSGVQKPLVAPSQTLRTLAAKKYTELTAIQKNTLTKALTAFAKAVQRYQDALGLPTTAGTPAARAKTLLDRMATVGPSGGPLTQEELNELLSRLYTNKEKVVLQPLTTYTLRGATYTTDDYGRLATVVFTITKLTPGGRDSSVTEAIGKLVNKTGDVGFHLIGDQFGGSTYYPNIIPADADLNANVFNRTDLGGAFGRLEGWWVKAVGARKTVSDLTIGLEYSATEPLRPLVITVGFTIDSERFFIRLPNRPGVTLPAADVTRLQTLLP